MVFRSVRAVSGLAAICSLAVFGLAADAQATSSTPSAQQTPQQSAPSQPAQQSAPPLQLHDLPAPPHTPTPQEAEQEQRQRILMQVSRLATLEAQWGPESSTVGMSIELKEVGRTKAADGTTEIAWQITGKGFAPDQKLELVRWPLDARPQVLMNGIQLNSQGVAVCVAPPLPATGAESDSSQGLAAAAQSLKQNGAAPAPAAPAPAAKAAPAPQGPSCATTTKPGQPVELRAAVAAGEAVRVALAGQSEKNGSPVRKGAETSVVPYPMQNTDKACTLQVIRGMKNAGLVLVEGTGFPPGQAMQVDAVTGDQTRTIKANTDASGRFIIATLPGLEGKNEGDTTVHMSATRPAPSLEASKTPAPAAALACNPSVTFHWGQDSYKPQ